MLIFLSGSNKGATHRSLKPSPEWVSPSERSWLGSYIERERVSLSFSSRRPRSVHSQRRRTCTATLQYCPQSPAVNISRRARETGRPRRVCCQMKSIRGHHRADWDRDRKSAPEPDQRSQVTDLPPSCPAKRFRHGALRIGTALFSPARDLAAEAEPLDQHGTVGSAKCSSNKFQCVQTRRASGVAAPARARRPPPARR